MQFTSPQTELQARRAAANLRLIDIAIAAECAPATVRAYEAGMTVRPKIAARLRRYYDSIPRSAGATVGPRKRKR